MSDKPIRVGIVAGEASGDTLAAGLMRELKKQHSNIQFSGIAGPQMQAEGCHSLFNMEELSVMGLAEVLSRIRRLLQVRKVLVEHFTHNPPDVFIGVDAPDFNLGVEMRLKAQGIKTVHYVSPTVWAWREKRIFKIAKATNLVLSIFPFEKKYYDQYQIPCAYIGHTLADNIALEPDKQQARSRLNMSADQPVLAILPGSRKREVDTLLPIFVDAARLVKQKLPAIRLVIPAVNQQRREQIQAYLKDCDVSVEVLDGQARELMIAADGILLASGTAALEALLCKRPMVVAYQLKHLTHFMMRFLYKQNFFSLPNILAGEQIVPELLQKQANPQNIADNLLPLISGEQQQVNQRFMQIHQSLRLNADQQAAKAVSELINAG